MNGFINLLKPSGMTSSDAVLAVRRLLPRGTAVGHGGTLDPEAAGVLPVCVGKATRLFDYIIDKSKVYIGELLLGVSTDTEDATGKILSASDASRVSEETLKDTLKLFVGDIMQVPPMYSALKLSGEPLYRKARKGESLELTARNVRIDAIDLLGTSGENRYMLKITCGKGVYIRSLMRDIGQRLGVGGCMSFLVRAKAGTLDVGGSLSLDELSSLENISDALLPMDAMLTAYPKATLDASKRANVLNGQSFNYGQLAQCDARPGDVLRLYVESEFAGMATMDGEGRVKINAMLLERE